MRVDRITVIFKATCDCNLNCQYCYDRASREKFRGTHVTPEIVDHTAKLLSEYAENVEWTWHGGECTLMGKQFYYDMQDIFNKYYSTNFKQLIQSNGVLASQDHSWIDMANDLGIIFGLSFDAYTQQLRMKSADPNKVFNQYMDLFHYIEDTSDMPVGVINVVHNKNIDSLIQVYELYKSEFREFALAYNFIFSACGNSNNDLSISPDVYSRYYTEYLRHIIFDTDANAMSERSIEFHFYLVLGTRQGTLCECVDCRKRWLGIQPTGEITYCDRELSDKYYIGNILDFNSVEEIFNSKGYTALMEDMHTRLSETCSKCLFYFACKGNCHSNHASANNGLVDKVNKDICLKTQTNYLNTLEVLSSIKLDTPLNPKILDIILSSPSLLPCEIEYFLNQLNIDFKFTWNFQELHHNPLELANSTSWKVFQCFNRVLELQPHTSKVTSRCLIDYIGYRKHLFDKSYRTNFKELQTIMVTSRS